MRNLYDHKTNPANDDIEIRVVDEPGQGGANHIYQILWQPDDYSLETCDIKFQNGPIKEFGVNGLTQEVLLTIVVDRLRSFQKGPFSCRENAVALTHCEDALMWLQKRTRDRMLRGVEGTNTI